MMPFLTINERIQKEKEENEKEEEKETQKNTSEMKLKRYSDSF